MKPDHIVSIDIQAETVLGIRMERTEGTVPVLSGRLEPDTQMGFGVIEDRIEIRHGLDVVVGGHGGIIGKMRMGLSRWIWFFMG
jgi:hypothetical protein